MIPNFLVYENYFRSQIDEWGRYRVIKGNKASYKLKVKKQSKSFFEKKQYNYLMLRAIGAGARAGRSRVFLAPWSRSRSQSRLKKKRGAGAGAA
jgi:hypothetical protein